MPFSVHVDRAGQLLASDVRTASSLWARFLGLMGRAALAPGEGLWFPGDTSIHMLFMRFPIDAVFLAPVTSDPATPAAEPSGDDAPDGWGTPRRVRPPTRAPDRWRVVAIRPHLRPWTGVVWFVRGARGCLELEAGAASAVNLRVGDIVSFARQ